MKKGNMETSVQDKRRNDKPSTGEISEELQKAIQKLIAQMRERGSAQRF